MGCVFQMTNPAIQNDFSYYRRTLSRMRMAGGVGQLVRGSSGQGERRKYFISPCIISVTLLFVF